MKKVLLLHLLFLLFSQTYAKDFYVKILDNPAIQSAQIFKEISRRYLFKKTCFKEISGVKNLYVFSCPDSRLKVVPKLEEVKGIEYIEEVPFYTPFFTPNDPLFSQQDYLQQIAINDLLDISHDSDKVIAVLDEGFALNHPDLHKSFFKNLMETPNGIDDDGNGYVDDVLGWDFGDGDSDVSAISGDDHGTFCASIAGGTSDNDTGITSVGFNAKILPLKIKSSGSNSYVSVHDALLYAVENGADVIAIPWGGFQYSQTIQLIIDYVYSKGVVVVASVGNHHSNVPIYPAAYNHVIAVGSVDSQDKKSSFSNYGSWVDIMAPGELILGCVDAPSFYSQRTGTSASSMLVAGVVSHMLSLDPYITVDEVEQCLKNAADNISMNNPGYTNQLGAGRLNAKNTINCLQLLYADFTTIRKKVCVGETIVFDDQTNKTPTSWQWNFFGGNASNTSIQNPSVVYPSSGFYDVELIVDNGITSDTIIKPGYIEVYVPSATITDTIVVQSGDHGYMPVTLLGVAPWKISYTDGDSVYTVDGIMDSIYYIKVYPETDTTIYSLLTISDANCSGNVSGEVLVLVDDVCYEESSIYQLVANGDLKYRSVTNNDDNVLLSLSKDSTDLLLVYLDGNKQVIWSKKLAGYGADRATLFPTSDSAFIVAGYQFNSLGRIDAVLFKIDIAGNILWSKQMNVTGNTYITDVYELKDTSIAVCGTVNFTGFVSRINSTGDILWSNRYTINTLGNLGQLHLTSIYSEDDAIYVVGNNLNQTRTGVLIKLNLLGHQVWQKRHRVGSDWLSYLDLSIKDSILTVVGQKREGILQSSILTSIDVNGNYLSAKEIRGAVQADRILALNILEDSDETIILSGVNRSGDVSFLISRVDSLGFFENTFYDYPGSISINRFGENMVATSHQKNLFGTVGNKVYLNELKKCAENCFKEEYLPDIVNTQIQSTDMSYIIQPVNNFVDVSLLLQNEVVSVDTFCTSKKCDLMVDFQYEMCNQHLFVEEASSSSAELIDWYWDFGDGETISGERVLSHQYTDTGTYQVTLIAYTNEQPFCVDSITQTIHVTSNMIIYRDTVVGCENDSGKIYFGDLLCQSVPKDSVTYVFYPSSIIGGFSEDSISFLLISDTVITVEVIYLGDIIEVVYFPIKVDPFCCNTKALIGEFGSLCVGEKGVFSSETLSTPGISYQWNFGPFATPEHSSGVLAEVSYSQSGEFDVMLIVSDSCSSDTVMKSIYVAPKPTIKNFSDTVFCSKDTLELYHENLIDFDYLWENNLGVVSDSFRLTKFIEKPATYYTTITDPITGCLSKDTFQVYYFDSIVVSDTLHFCGKDSFIYQQSIIINDTVITTNHLNYMGCDSLHHKVFVFHEDFIRHDTIMLCGDEKYIVGQNVYSESGVYEDIFPTIHGCDSIISTTVTVCNLPIVDFIIDKDSICKGECVFVENNSMDYDTLIWETRGIVSEISYGKEKICFTSSGEVLVRLIGRNSFGSDTLDKLITIYPVPEVLLGGDKSIDAGESVLLNSEFYDNGTYLWSPAVDLTCSQCMDPLAYPSETTSYFLAFSDENNCVGGDSITVHVTEELNWYIPNTFTPDGDGMNDVFMIKAEKVVSFELVIFNRWGQLLFKTNSLSNGWTGKHKGKELPSGAYVYEGYISFTKNIKDKFVGKVQLLR